MTPVQHFQRLLNRAGGGMRLTGPPDEDGNAHLAPAEGWKFRDEGGPAQLPIRIRGSVFQMPSLGFSVVLGPSSAADLLRDWVVPV